MSKPEDNGMTSDAAAFERLEVAVGQLLEGLEAAKARAVLAEAKNSELVKLLSRFTGDEEEAGRLVGRLKGLESENADLRARLDRGREGVDRMIARIHFLENQA